jgi:cobalt-zinc-cadmium efflux system protein
METALKIGALEASWYWVCAENVKDLHVEELYVRVLKIAAWLYSYAWKDIGHYDLAIYRFHCQGASASICQEGRKWGISMSHRHADGFCHHHHHTHGMAKRALRWAFFLTCVTLSVGVIGGLLAHSLALLSDAAHTLTDLFALGVAWFAAKQAERPSNEYKTFGYHRVGILAALLNAVTLVMFAVLICWEAIQRLQHPEPVQPLIMFVSSGLGILINLVVGFGLRKESHNLNVRAAAMHVFGDVGVSVAVIVAGLIVLITGWTFIDPLLSMVVALWLAVGTWGIIRETIEILLEAVPRGISLKHLVADMQGVAGVQTVHDLHVWSISSGMPSLSCHVLIDNLSSGESAHILHSLKHLLHEKYNINHSTIQLEYNHHHGVSCKERELYCRFDAVG